MKESELCSILAHELGHWARSHTLQMFVASNVRNPFFAYLRVLTYHTTD